MPTYAFCPYGFQSLQLYKKTCYNSNITSYVCLSLVFSPTRWNIQKSIRERVLSRACYILRNRKRNCPCKRLEESRMITWQEVRKELLSDPEVQHEYDILKQNEEAKQRRLNHVEKTHSKPSSAPSHSSQPTYA